MRVRKLTPPIPGGSLLSGGDMTFGHGAGDYFINKAEGVGQLVSTRLRLWLGQWFLNVNDGTPYLTRVLGKYTDDFRDATIQQRILATPNVTGLRGYNSTLDRQTRLWTVHGTVQTKFGAFTPLVPFNAGAAGDWLLASGAWSDTGAWQDSSTWTG